VSLFTVKWTFLIFMAAVIGLGLWELGRALGEREIRLPLLPVAAGGALMLALAYTNGSRPLVAALAVTVIGVLAGRHPMAPVISPSKTWEGLAGSVAACAVAGVLVLTLLLHGTWWQGIVLGVAAVAAATLGDLSESMIKRDLQIKDMGRVLPGHGGILDRIDSLLITAPVVWLLLTIFLN
jgi:phosphatidate cytidylyltransferase